MARHYPSGAGSTRGRDRNPTPAGRIAGMPWRVRSGILAEVRDTSIEAPPALIRVALFTVARQFKCRQKPCIVQLRGQSGQSVLASECLQIGEHVEDPFILHAGTPLMGYGNLELQP